jgi:hypothetical protein
VLLQRPVAAEVVAIRRKIDLLARRSSNGDSAMAAGLRTIILAGLVSAGGVVLPDLKLDDPAPIQDRSVQALSVNAEPFSVLEPTATAEPGLADADTEQARTEGRGESEVRETTAAEPPQMRVPEPPPMQMAALTPLDELHHDAKEAPNDIKTAEECLSFELCIDQYLWSRYQRARKVDTIKVVEQKKASVVKKGKLRTIIQNIVKLVQEDFTWKDPAAAEKAGMEQMDYVIGGMDRGFRMRLYRALRAMDDAGLGPGITSAFRDDYRQSLASGLKAASNRSYHGGSLRGGYGHGLAADLVSVNGATDAERWDSNEKLWNWIDAHGKDFGIGRPYLDKDPPHVAPIDGQEYAAHRRGGKQYADPRHGRNTRQALR